MPRDAHVIDRVEYAAETITCRCGVVVTAPPDPVARDAHEPLAAAWREHRRRFGLKTFTLAQLAERGWSEPDTPWSSGHARSAARGARASVEARRALVATAGSNGSSEGPRSAVRTGPAVRSGAYHPDPPGHGRPDF
ncbi:MAG: hypothetical protein L0227_09780 [Chloroflexi bacterium]|nr:hypothetical protein [Chloroflexota bacterium]